METVPIATTNTVCVENKYGYLIVKLNVNGKTMGDKEKKAENEM